MPNKSSGDKDKPAWAQLEAGPGSRAQNGGVETSDSHHAPGSSWNTTHAAALRSFLDADHGRALTARLNFVAAQVAICGAAKTKDTIHAAGISTGWQDCLAYIISLSRVSSVEDTAPADAIGQYGQRPEDEAALTARLSP